MISTTVVISQFQVAGTTAGDEFVELHNLSGTAVDLNGHRIVYRSAAGTTDAMTLASWTVATVIPAGGYYLIASSLYDGSVAPNITYTTSSGALSGTGGGLALRNGSTNTGTIIDSVGYGSSATNNFIETAATTAPAANAAKERSGSGCAETDDNSSDFALLSPSAPRNGATALLVCGNGTTGLSGTGAANPASVLAGNSTLLTVSVTPGTNPPSTGITAVGNLTSIGGSATQMFFDDGTNGDAAPGDNIFSYAATIPAGVSSGNRSVPVSVADAQSRTASASIIITVVAADSPGEHLVLGNPSAAATDVNMPFNYLLLKDQYAMSYHRDRGIPNWVSWHLDSSWIGLAQRQNDFRTDPSLPAGWYRVTNFDYSGSGFDRGHHTPSGDRTRSIPDNSATFFMTNMMPQAPGNNQGPWESLESFSRTLVGQGNELYVLSAGVGMGGVGANGVVTNTIANGKVTVPSYTWKVILVLPVGGGDDAARVDTNTRTIAVIAPNIDSIRSDSWQKYLATVDQVEALTGYDFFSNVPPSIQEVIESRLDAASNTAPQTISGGTYSNLDVTAPNTTITGNITVTGNLKLGGSRLNTAANFCVTLGANASVTRISGYVNSCVEKQFPATTPISFEYPVGTANGYSPVTANVTTAAAGSALKVKAVQSVQPNVTAPNTALRRYWTLTETGALTADLIFKYLDADIPVGVMESSFTLQRYEGGTFTTIPATIDPAANTATAFGISQFSDWTLVSAPSPTAANVSISGRVILPDEIGITEALVTLTDTEGNSRTVLTRKSGSFRFADVAVGETYILSVWSRRATYAPQVVTVTEDLTDLSFTPQ